MIQSNLHNNAKFLKSCTIVKYLLKIGIHAGLAGARIRRFQAWHVFRYFAHFCHLATNQLIFWKRIGFSRAVARKSTSVGNIFYCTYKIKYQFPSNFYIIFLSVKNGSLLRDFFICQRGKMRRAWSSLPLLSSPQVKTRRAHPYTKEPEIIYFISLSQN